MRQKRTASKKTDPGFDYTVRSKDLPATQSMLQLVRTELKREMRAGFRAVDAKLDLIDSRFSHVDSRFSQIDSRFNQIDSRFSQIDSQFNQIDARFNQIDARFSEFDSRFNSLESGFEQVRSELARVAFLVEEQNSRNQVVLEGLTALWQRQERLETRVDGVENTIKSIGRGTPGSL